MVNGEPRWLGKEEVLAFHALALARFGGSDGVRDLGLLSSALDRPRNLWAYERATLPLLAAAYAEGVAKNHPFIDGNKRTAFTCMAVFLEKNGQRLVASEGEVIVAMLRIADGSMTREVLAKWVADNIEPASSP